MIIPIIFLLRLVFFLLDLIIVILIFTIKVNINLSFIIYLFIYLFFLIYTNLLNILLYKILSLK